MADQQLSGMDSAFFNMHCDNNRLDIVRAFQIAGAESRSTINIQGTAHDPLFQANQIGALLGIRNIHETIRDFDEEEKTKGISNPETVGGTQTVIFLTEVGLYRLMHISRKPIARKFQKWANGVIRELRQHHDSEMERRLKEQRVILESNQVSAAESTRLLNDVQSQLVSSGLLIASTASKAARIARHVALVSANLNTTCAYSAIVLEIDDVSFVFKVGETDDIKTRSVSLKAQYGMFVLLDVFPCVQAHRFEQNVIHTPHFIARKYTGTVNAHAGNELFIVDASWPYEVNVRAFLTKKVEEFNGRREDFMELQRFKLQERQMKVREMEALAKMMDGSTHEQREELLRLFNGRVENNSIPAPCSVDDFPQETLVIDSLSVMDAPSFLERDDAPDGPQPFLMHKTCDKRIQQYDEDDLTRLIATHNGTREAARSILGARDSSIRTAYTLNEAYMGYRWFAITRNDPLGPDVARDIPPTAPPNRRKGRVAQISFDKTHIVAVFCDQVRAAEAVGLRNSSSITNAQRFNKTAAGHWWAQYDACDDELLATFDLTNVDEGDSQNHARGNRVQQIEPATGEVVNVHASMTVVCRDFQASHKYIHRASEQKSVYKNFRWKLVN